MKKHLSTILLFVVLLTGLSLLLYPSFSDYWNSFHQSKAIAGYSEAVADLDTETYDELWREAKAYNQKLLRTKNRFEPDEGMHEDYLSQLDAFGSGIMGVVEIPSIACKLPIYHGVEESVLQVAVGHIEGTSLPVGGEGTHCVLSGHRGLPSAKLFTDLDKIVEGDVFLLQILGETLTYEVDQILIVLPDEMEALEIEGDKDYCTLVTCTPYGINSHRMLVRGHRIENAVQEKLVRVTADAGQIAPEMVAPLIAAPMLLILLVWVLVGTGSKGNTGRKESTGSAGSKGSARSKGSRRGHMDKTAGKDKK